MSRPNIARQDEAWRLCHDEGLSQREAGRRMGMDQPSVRRMLERYMARTGHPGPVPAWGMGGREAPVAERVAASEQRIADRLDMLDARLDLIEAKLDALLARPAVVPFAPDHRRVADGGRHVAEQRRAARRGAA